MVVCGVYGYRIVLTEWKLMRGSDSTQKEREKEKRYMTFPLCLCLEGREEDFPQLMAQWRC